MKKTTRHYRTIDVARAAGVHPNTVRLYEEWGFLPPVPRAANGYRLFTQEHLDQMCLARLALHGAWPGPKIKRSAADLIKVAASGDLGGALELAYNHLSLVQAERAQADAAVAFLERWAKGGIVDATDQVLRVGQAAELLGVSTDVLRNWERNGLIRVPRSPTNGYRLYGAQEIGRLRVIRALLRAGYSTMAVLRMLIAFDRGQKDGLREVLDTPREDEDVYMAFDQWLSALDGHEARARQMISMLEARIERLW